MIPKHAALLGQLMAARQSQKAEVPVQVTLPNECRGRILFLNKLHISLSFTSLWRRGPGRGGLPRSTLACHVLSGSPLPIPLPADAGRGDENTLLIVILPKSNMRPSAALVKK